VGKLSEEMLFEGVCVELSFAEPGPRLGNLLELCGLPPGQFSSDPRYELAAGIELGFRQVDDYFGIPAANEDEGTDVIVWLYPLRGGEEVDHDAGPFDGVRLSYNVVANPVARVNRFLGAVETIARLTRGRVHYPARGADLGFPPDLGAVRADIDAIIRYWLSEDVEPGSDEALDLDF
jgi:hypothetical protein